MKLTLTREQQFKALEELIYKLENNMQITPSELEWVLFYLKQVKNNIARNMRAYEKTPKEKRQEYYLRWKQKRIDSGLTTYTKKVDNEHLNFENSTPTQANVVQTNNEATLNVNHNIEQTEPYVYDNSTPIIQQTPISVDNIVNEPLQPVFQAAEPSIEIQHNIVQPENYVINPQVQPINQENYVVNQYENQDILIQQEPVNTLEEPDVEYSILYQEKQQ